MQQLKLDELQARIFLHEFDHLQSVLFHDRMEAEVLATKQRTARFTKRGLALMVADVLACRLVQRDRDEDDRRVCPECARFTRGACGVGLVPVGGGGLEVLHRCDSFVEGS